MHQSSYKREKYTFICANLRVINAILNVSGDNKQNITVQKPFINIFTTLFAIQQHSWTTLVWVGQSLKRLYEQLSGFVFNTQILIFDWKPVLLDFTMSVNLAKFIRFLNVFWPLAKCHKEAKYHSNKIVLSMRKKLAKEDSLGAKVDYL